MGLIAAIKSLLGVDDAETGRGTDVTVEREPDASTERAVKTSADTGTTSERGSGEGSTSGGVSDGETDDGTEASGEPVREIKGIGPAYAERLADAGVRSVDELAGATAAELAEETGIGESRIETWIERAQAR